MTQLHTTVSATHNCFTGFIPQHNELIKITCQTALYPVHWANDETAAIEILPNTHQNKRRYIV